jgi:hypothetical protein
MRELTLPHSMLNLQSVGLLDLMTLGMRSVKALVEEAKFGRLRS